MHLQEVLAQAVGGQQRQRIIETGSIRGGEDHDLVGDGWSTVYFASLNPDLFYSIDLDTSACLGVLKRHHYEDRVCLMQEHSIDGLARLLRSGGGFKYDVAFLDSANDAQLVFHEFLIAKELVKPATGTIIIDDCSVDPSKHDMAAVKGLHVIPYLKDKGWSWRILDREGWNGYKTGVLIINRL